MPDPPPSAAADLPAGLQVLLHDGPLLAVNKPAGLLTQAPPGIDSLEVRVKQYFREREGKTGNIYLGVPHRLDRPVSGVIVFARHVRAARRIAEQFERREVAKTYWALVAGTIQPDAGTWTDHLCKLAGEPRTVVVDARDPLGRIAILHYTVLGRFPATTWLEIRLETGRTHQIRVQAASRGHAVLGDQQYGSDVDFGPPVEDPRERRIALHARSLSLQHPMTRQPLSIVAPPPPPWRGATGAPADGEMP
jgi:RluA family pseudouridine synthase